MVQNFRQFNDFKIFEELETVAQRNVAYKWWYSLPLGQRAILCGKWGVKVGYKNKDGEVVYERPTVNCLIQNGGVAIQAYLKEHGLEKLG